MLRGIRLHLVVLLVLFDWSLRVKNLYIGFLYPARFSILAATSWSLVVWRLRLHFLWFYYLLAGNKYLIGWSIVATRPPGGGFHTPRSSLVWDTGHFFGRFNLWIFKIILSVYLIWVNHCSIIFASHPSSLPTSCSILRVDRSLSPDSIPSMLNSALILRLSIFSVSDGLKVKFLVVIINILINNWSAVCKLLVISTYVPWASLIFIIFLVVVGRCLGVAPGLADSLPLVGPRPTNSTFPCVVRLNCSSSAATSAALAIVSSCFVLNHNFLFNVVDVLLGSPHPFN